MAPAAVWSQLLLLGLSRMTVSATPIQDELQPGAHDAQDEAQKSLRPPPEGIQSGSRRLNGRFLHITDFHPDQFYKVHSSTEEGSACHRKKGLAGSYGAETTDCDSPFSLVNATLDWVEKNLKDDIDFVVWTGDSARHDSDEKHPRSANEVLETNQMMADKFAHVFSSKHKGGGLDIPVVPTWGNNDFLPHNIFYPGPNKWLRHYSDIWSPFIPEAQRHSFEFGGWFSVEVIPNHLAVLSLNTMYFFDRNAGVDGCANPSEPGYQHLEWLRVQLKLLRERNMKAILIGHVPPARTNNKQNWDETCWQRYTLWLKQYRDVVTASLYGHMNIDHFLIQDTRQVNIDSKLANANTRESIDDGFSIESKEDYLQDLRKMWSDLPGSAIKLFSADDDDDEDNDGVDISKKGKKHKKKGKKGKKKKDKYKKIGGKYAERYHVSLVSPSIVPNYFPTLRVIEYNVTGMENTPVWADTTDQNLHDETLPDDWVMVEDEGSEEEDVEDFENMELKRDLEIEGKKKKKKGKKKKKKKKPKTPNLEIPDDPPKGSTPGPAYFPQPLTLTGYTQYFANLTYINNDLTQPDVKGSKWRDGDYDQDDAPKNKSPKPHDFEFEIEYSTSDDDVYKMDDLTVKNYLKLAHKISKAGSMALDASQANNEVDVELQEEEGPDSDSGSDSDSDSDDSDSNSDDEVDARSKGKKKHKKKKGKKKPNKTWIGFLDRAFVRTVPQENLEKMA